jgi:ribonuclease BN (tRNA processing enzyme)
LVHDAQYRENEVESYRGWGHSTPGVAAAVARSAGVGKLILTHHAPARTDDQIDEMEAAAMNLFENTVAAHENMTVTVP